MLYGYSAMPEYCKAAKETGFDYVELPGKVIAAMSDRDFLDFEKNLPIPALAMNAFCPAEVVISGSGYDLAIVREYSERLSARAEALGVKFIGVGSPMSRTLPDNFDRDLSLKQIENFLLESAYIFEKRGIRMCLEALATCYCNTVNTTAQALEIIRRIDYPSVKLVLDFYNMEHMDEADIELTDLPIIHAHISDDDGAPNLRSYLKPEKRGIHQKRIKRLAETGYKGGLTLEVDVPYDAERAACSLAIMKETIK